ncbi:MAG TPA: DNA polymerase IV [Desulfuromonadales bacterium]|nr:DNA polymerase IV [Desulfuromonadales bacterium]
MEKTVLHLDLDAFYASVEQLDNPALRGRPVIVGGHSSRGVVSAASYEARAYGVHSAMPMARASRLCPEATILPVRMGRYRDLSQQVFAVYHEFTDRIEPLSIDEAFLDVTASIRLFGAGREIGQAIRHRVRERTGLTVSAGVSFNKHLAKMASDRAKPDGVLEVRREQVEDFLHPLSVGELWGIGQVGVGKLEQHGILRVADIVRVDEDRLKKLLGNKAGEQIWRLANGIDEREVVPEQEEKSVGAEKTFLQDLYTVADFEKALLLLAEEVGRRIRSKKYGGRCVTLKVRYDDFTTLSRSQTKSMALRTTAGIYQAARELLERTASADKPVRLLGITLSRLENDNAGQVELFADQQEARREKLDKAVDSLRTRFGANGVVRGTLLDEGSKE